MKGADFYRRVSTLKKCITFVENRRDFKSRAD